MTIRDRIRAADWPVDDVGKKPGVGYVSEALAEGEWEHIAINTVEPEGTSVWEGAQRSREEIILIDIVVRSMRPARTEDLAADRLRALCEVVQGVIRDPSTGRPHDLCVGQVYASVPSLVWQVFPAAADGDYVGQATIRVEVKTRI